MSGRVEAIFISSEAEGPMAGVSEVRAVEGSGLEGDRYAAKVGSFSRKPDPGREVTLVEAEAIEAARRGYGLDGGLDVGIDATRRNVVTREVALNHLVGREFSVGSVRLRGVRLCEPCEHMEKLSGVDGIRKAMLHRGGLRADIVEGGTISVGDAVEAS